MLELDRTAVSGDLCVDSRAHVMAWLLFPHDEESRIDYGTLMFAWYLCSLHENDEDEVRGLSKAALWNLALAPHPRAFEDSLKRGTFWGETAGNLVLTVMTLKKEIGKDASLGKSIKVIQHRLISRVESQGRNQPCSISSIKTRWKEYQPVAHLCGPRTSPPPLLAGSQEKQAYAYLPLHQTTISRLSSGLQNIFFSAGAESTSLNAKAHGLFHCSIPKQPGRFLAT